MKTQGIIVGGALLALAGCSQPEADVKLIEDEVAAGIEEQADISGVTVDCPDSINWEPGGEFHCFADEGSVRVTVSMENEDGEWSWVVG